MRGLYTIDVGLMPTFLYETRLCLTVRCLFTAFP